MTRRTMLVRIMLAALLGGLALSTAACGKKGAPVLPPGETDQFPQKYPKNADPQTGVFSS
ncbi:MAG: hypothetical protein R3D05_16315 [Dongiaceae bacterium]